MAAIKNSWTRLVELGFHLLYHQFAPTYDLVSWLVSFGKWRQWQLAALPYLRGRDVLELAHGPGHMLIVLGQAGYKVTGADLSPQMGRLARQRTRAHDLPIHLLQADAQQLPLAGSSFDSILSTFPTEFIADRATVAEMHRLLREKGRFVIVPQARLTGGSPAIRALEFLYRITGQRNTPSPAGASESTTPAFDLVRRHFESVGFDMRLEIVAQPGSEVTIIVASKRERD